MIAHLKHLIYFILDTVRKILEPLIEGTSIEIRKFYEKFLGDKISAMIDTCGHTFEGTF